MRELKLLAAKFSWVSPLALSECSSRFEELLKEPRASDKVFSLRPGVVTGTLNGNRFSIFAAGRRYSGNVFSPFFLGRLDEHPLGTRIQGRFVIPPLLLGGIVFWSLIFWVFGVIGVAGAFLRLWHSVSQDAGVVLLFGLSSLALPVMTVGVLLRASRYQFICLERAIIECFKLPDEDLLVLSSDLQGRDSENASE